MIEKNYAVHLKNTLDAAAINVCKPRTKPKLRKRKATGRLSRGQPTQQK